MSPLKWFVAKRFLPEAKYLRTAHADIRAPSLWWASNRDRREAVVREYLKRYAHGRKVPADLEREILADIEELIRLELRPARSRRPQHYWTLPAYALAHGRKKSAFLKRFQKLERIARELFSAGVPPTKLHVTEEVKQGVRARFWVEYWTVEVKPLANEFPWSVVIARTAEATGVPAFRIGQICRDIKASLTEEAEQWLLEAQDKIYLPSGGPPAEKPVEESDDPFAGPSAKF